MYDEVYTTTEDMLEQAIDSVIYNYNNGYSPKEIYQRASDVKHQALVSMAECQDEMFTSHTASEFSKNSWRWLSCENAAARSMIIMAYCYYRWPEYSEDYQAIRAKFKSPEMREQRQLQQ